MTPTRSAVVVAVAFLLTFTLPTRADVKPVTEHKPNDAATGVDAFAAYVDGVAQTMTFTQVNGTIEPAGFSDFDLPAAFAARNVRGTGTDPFTREANVTLDEVALYGSVLTPAQVASNAAAVPEPAALSLFAAAGLTLLRRRRV